MRSHCSGMARPFAQVDVFTTEPYLGNPVAVVLGADGIADDAMQRFARWTNLSETTFVLAPESAEADYRVRIFTPGRELPFAGHPTLGTCHAWLEAGGEPQAGDVIVQECGAGLVPVRRTDAGLAFAAPPLLRGGPVEEEIAGPGRADAADRPRRDGRRAVGRQRAGLDRRADGRPGGGARARAAVRRARRRRGRAVPGGFAGGVRGPRVHLQGRRGRRGPGHRAA